MSKTSVVVGLFAVITVSCGGASEGSIFTTAAPTTAAVTNTIAPTTTTQQSTTTTLPPTTTTEPSTTTTTSTTVAETTTTTATTVGSPGPECSDCPGWATGEDVEYVASMRLLASLYGSSFVTSMTAFDIIDMGQTVCSGLDGSYGGSFDNALAALLIIYSPSQSNVGLAISAMEQSARLYCAKYSGTWKSWAGSDPGDPFE